MTVEVVFRRQTFEFPEERWEQHVLQFMQGETHVEGKYAAEIRKDTQFYRHT